MIEPDTATEQAATSAHRARLYGSYRTNMANTRPPLPDERIVLVSMPVTDDPGFMRERFRPPASIRPAGPAQPSGVFPIYAF
jgi:hypothetical protein